MLARPPRRTSFLARSSAASSAGTSQSAAHLAHARASRQPTCAGAAARIACVRHAHLFSSSRFCAASNGTQRKCTGHLSWQQTHHTHTHVWVNGHVGPTASVAGGCRTHLAWPVCFLVPHRLAAVHVEVQVQVPAAARTAREPNAAQRAQRLQALPHPWRDASRLQQVVTNPHK